MLSGEVNQRLHQNYYVWEHLNLAATGRASRRSERVKGLLAHFLRVRVAPPFANRRTHRTPRSPRKSPEKRLRPPPADNRRTPFICSRGISLISFLLIVAPSLPSEL